VASCQIIFYCLILFFFITNNVTRQTCTSWLEMNITRCTIGQQAKSNAIGCVGGH
jgi:hypothetical protein